MAEEFTAFMDPHNHQIMTDLSSVVYEESFMGQ